MEGGECVGWELPMGGRFEGEGPRSEAVLFSVYI
jgi:hypothetical protein